MQFGEERSRSRVFEWRIVHDMMLERIECFGDWEREQLVWPTERLEGFDPLGENSISKDRQEFSMQYLSHRYWKIWKGLTKDKKTRNHTGLCKDLQADLYYRSKILEAKKNGNESRDVGLGYFMKGSVCHHKISLVAWIPHHWLRLSGIWATRRGR